MKVTQIGFVLTAVHVATWERARAIMVECALCPAESRDAIIARELAELDVPETPAAESFPLDE